MAHTTIAPKEQLNRNLDTDSSYKTNTSPISEEEADEIEFKSLKGITGIPLDADEIRKERLSRYGLQD